MNYKKAYTPTIGYTKLCQIGQCSLKKLEFGILELNPGDRLPFYTEGNQVAFRMPEGHCNVTAGDQRWENIGNRRTVFENRKAESFYMPREQQLEIEAIDQACALPKIDIAHLQKLLEENNVIIHFDDALIPDDLKKSGEKVDVGHI